MTPQEQKIIDGIEAGLRHVESNLSLKIMRMGNDLAERLKGQTLGKHHEHPQQITINVYQFFIGGHMNLDRLNSAVAQNTSIGDVLDSIFDAIAAAIREAGTSQSALDALATKLESDNVRENLRVNALRDLVTPPPVVLSATWNGPTAGVVGDTFAGAVIAAGGTAPYTFTQDSGALPDGTTFSADGAVSGTLALAGEFSFGGSVTDAANATATWSATVSVS